MKWSVGWFGLLAAESNLRVSSKVPIRIAGTRPSNIIQQSTIRIRGLTVLEGTVSCIQEDMKWENIF